jgi:hypothetical protein
MAFKVFLPVIVFLSFISSAFAVSSGDKVHGVGFCKSASSVTKLAQAVVANKTAEQVGEVAKKAGDCVHLPVPAEVTLKRVVGVVKGTDGRPDINIWQVENETGQIWYGLTYEKTDEPHRS